MISRKEFLKKTFAGGMTALTYLICAGILEKERNEFDLSWLDNPEQYSFRLRHPALPVDNRGIFVNTPFLYLAPDEDVDRLLLQLAPWTKGVRVFINDRYEPKLGEYNKKVLARLITYGEKLAAMGKTLQVDLLDGYTMHHTWNPIYGANVATSRYVVAGNEAFFSEEVFIDAFIQRVRSILPTILTIPNLSAISIANELRPARGRHGRLEFAKWYQKVVSEIRQWTSDIPIYSGVARPSLLPPITRLTANTAHLYPFLQVEQDLMESEQVATQPIVVQEIGATNTYFGIVFPVGRDEILSEYLRSVLYQTTSVDQVSKIVTLGTSTIYPWKLDNYVDGFHIDESFENTNEMLATLAFIYEGLN